MQGPLFVTALLSSVLCTWGHGEHNPQHPERHLLCQDEGCRQQSAVDNPGCWTEAARQLDKRPERGIQVKDSATARLEMTTTGQPTDHRSTGRPVKHQLIVTESIVRCIPYIHSQRHTFLHRPNISAVITPPLHVIIGFKQSRLSLSCYRMKCIIQYSSSWPQSDVRQLNGWELAHSFCSMSANMHTQMHVIIRLSE